MPRKKSIEQRAEEAKATGRRLTAAKQSLRDSLMVQRAAQGWTQAAIAAEAEVSERTVQRVVAHRQTVGEALLDRDPIDVVRDLATQWEGSIADMEAMASAYAESNPAVALGAKKGADQARERLVLLLQATGRMPRDMGGLGDLMGMRSLASDMVAVVHAFKQGKATAQDVEETFTRALGLGQRRELEADS